MSAPPILLKLETRSWDDVANSVPLQTIITIVLIGGISLATISTGRWIWRGLVALFAALGLAACAGGPTLLLAGLALALVGWKTARS